MKNAIFILLTGACALLSSCSKMAKTGSYANYDLPATKPTNPSNVRVKVSTSKQLVYVMEGQKPLLVMPVSVGTSSTPTPTGNYSITSKQEKRRAQTHGFFRNGSQIKGGYLRDKPAGWSFIGTPMPYWCEFRSAYGFHTGWMKDAPCTHGCIRMHENLAPKFFALTKVGTPVSIAHSQPEDATIGRDVPRPPDASSLPDHPMDLRLSDKIFSAHKKPTYN